MNQNEELIHRFYSAFQQLDAKTMMTCYHVEASFSDPVFELKTKQEISAMWTMLCERAQEFELTFEEVKANKKIGSAKWQAAYLFSQTNRKVINRIEAQFKFREGLIIEHTDSFNFWRWSKQALGIPGQVLGWTSFLKKKVQKQARKNLKRFGK
ncbi:MAG: nuclear transport factor 2 family protein [Gracilimonas sp.]